MLSHLSSEDSRIGLFLKHDESSFINDIIKLNLKIIQENINASTAARGLKVQFELSNESKVIGKELVKHIETYLSKRSDNSINITLNTINTPKDQQAHKALKIIENLKKYLTFREQIIKNQQMLDTLGISASDTEFFDNVTSHTISQNTPKDQQAHKTLKIIENLKKYLTFREQIIKNQQMLDTLGISASDTEFFDKIEHLNHDSDIIYKKMSSHRDKNRHNLIKIMIIDREKLQPLSSIPCLHFFKSRNLSHY
ncbi:hypothetical protein [Candidatus Lariskella endosymbiont of Hedychridium roseum]|uniref:hypothetical protein n=1 Tax=Candidatus Lariskella endosymbiont of Hedychridium roseum TaxID=3077949 RepID=UPI0030CF956F